MNTTTFLLGGCIKHRGLPIANVELTLMRAANRFAGTQAQPIVSINTPGSGEYRFPVEAGEYFLHVKPDQSTRFVSFRTEPIFVNGNTKLDVLLELGRVWSGKFISASGQADGYSYELKLWNDQGTPTMVKPLQLGKGFELVLERIPYKAMVIRHDRDDRHGDNSTSLAIWTQNLAAANDIRQDILLPDLFKLSGKVADEQNMPLKEARITILKEECLKRVTTDMPMAESILTADINGCFTATLPEGYYIATVEAPGMAAGTVSVNLNRDTEIDITVSAGLNANGQVLLKGMPVTALKLLISGVGRQFLLPTQIDEQGNFDVWVSQGSYEFRIGGLEHSWMPPAPSGELPTTIPEVSSETSASDEPSEITPTISSQANLTRLLAPWVRLIDVTNNIDGNIKLQDGYPVEFEVVDQNDHAISNCIVDCRLYEAERDTAASTLEYGDGAPYGILARVLTDATGRCRLITGAGVYTFDFIPSEESKAEPKQIRQLSINGSLRRKVRLTVAGTAEIIAMDSTDKTPVGIGTD